MALTGAVTLVARGLGTGVCEGVLWVRYSPLSSLLSLSRFTFSVTISCPGSSVSSLPRRDVRVSWWCVTELVSGVSERPRLAILTWATVAAPRIPRVRAVPPVICDGAGESGAESSLSSDSERSPSRIGRFRLAPAARL